MDFPTASCSFPKHFQLFFTDLIESPYFACKRSSIFNHRNSFISTHKLLIFSSSWPLQYRAYCARPKIYQRATWFDMRDSQTFLASRTKRFTDGLDDSSTTNQVGPGSYNLDVEVEVERRGKDASTPFGSTSGRFQQRNASNPASLGPGTYSVEDTTNLVNSIAKKFPTKRENIAFGAAGGRFDHFDSSCGQSTFNTLLHPPMPAPNTYHLPSFVKPSSSNTRSIDKDSKSSSNHGRVRGHTLNTAASPSRSRIVTTPQLISEQGGASLPSIELPIDAPLFHEQQQFAPPPTRYNTANSFQTVHDKGHMMMSSAFAAPYNSERDQRQSTPSQALDTPSPSTYTPASAGSSQQALRPQSRFLSPHVGFLSGEKREPTYIGDVCHINVPGPCRYFHNGDASHRLLKKVSQCSLAPRLQ